MRLIDRYILREFLLFFVCAFAVATFVLFLDKLLWLTTLALRSRLPWTTVLRFFGYLLPTVSGLTMPIAFLIGCTLAFNRLSTDSEYLVLKAAGVSFYRLLLPLLATAAVMYVCCSAIVMYVSPWGMQGLRQLLFEVARSRAHYHLEAGQFHDDFQGLVVYVQRTYPEVRRLEGIFIADTRAEPEQVITARTGEILVQEDALKVILRLQDGRLHRYEPDGKRYHLLRFENYDVQLNLDTQLIQQATRQRQARELYPAQLRAEIAQRQAAGKEVRSFLIFQQQRYTLPFACILFAVLGPGLGVVRTRSGRSGGYLLGIGAIFLYYIFSTAADAFGEETRLPPLLAAWLPNLVMMGLIPWLVHRANRDAAMIDLAGIWVWMGRQFKRCLRAHPMLK